MPFVTTSTKNLRFEMGTPGHLSFEVLVDGKRLQYQLTFQDEGLILEDVEDDHLRTLSQVLYSEHLSLELEKGMRGETVAFDDGEVQVILHTETSEGLHGDYDPEDPHDELLYRFDVNRKEGDTWVPVDNGSYCTAIRENASEQALIGYLHLIHDQVKDKVKGGISIKKVCERLSWMGSGDKNVDADVPTVP